MKTERAGPVQHGEEKVDLNSVYSSLKDGRVERPRK